MSVVSYGVVCDGRLSCRRRGSVVDSRLIDDDDDEHDDHDSR